MKFSSFSLCAFLATVAVGQARLQWTGRNYVRNSYSGQQNRKLQDADIKIGIVNQVDYNISDSAELWLDGINDSGGLQAGNMTYQVGLVIEGVNNSPEEAVTATEKVIADDVMAIVGPNWSSLAIPAGAIANEKKTPLISPTSTNPDTTQGRPFVFRGTFLDSLQGAVLAKFVAEEYNFTKAALLYDAEDPYSKGLANYFKDAWLEAHGPDSVVVEETFTPEPDIATKDLDFAPQLKAIVDSSAEFLFLPQYAPEVATIVNMANDMNWTNPIIGGDGWDESTLAEQCGSACFGYYFGTLYVADGATGDHATLIDNFQAKYGFPPDVYTAIAWDAMILIQNAIETCGENGSLTDDLDSSRQCIQESLAQTTDFPGVSGNYTFDEDGNPSKCVYIAYMDEDGSTKLHKTVCPDE